MFTKQKIAMVVAELLGTFVLTYVVLAVMVSNIGIGYFIALAAGLSLGLLVLLLGGVSGAVLNPAVTVGLWTARQLRTYQALVYLFVQLAGGILAYLLFRYVSGNDLDQREIVKFDVKAMIAEALGASVLAMGYAAATYQNLLSGIKAFVIGAAFTIGVILAASHGVAGYINPATAWGTHALDFTQWGSIGNFVLGPILGAVIGVNLYNLLFAASLPVLASASTAAVASPRAAARSKTVAAKPKAVKKTTRKTTKKK
jgi:glycerol uptake facilitator-like aquaporin